MHAITGMTGKVDGLVARDLLARALASNSTGWFWYRSPMY